MLQTPWFVAKLLIPTCLGVWLASSARAAADEPTFIERLGVVYGAQADERGPLGGGEGYRATVAGGDFEVATLDELLAALAQAQAGQTVFLPGETEIDLTARIYVDKLVLEIPSGVTLAGNRGVDGSRGAILVSDALDTPVMIRALGPDVRITGLRLQGPCPKRHLDHHRRAMELEGPEYRRYYYKFPTSNGIVTEHDRLEVDNCDISAFAHAGIDLRRGTGHHVHHSSIHHCQYQGLGYGVCHNVATSTIERNLFNWNRHSIAGTGRPGSGYVAAHNVELGESLSHCFDMHGGRDRRDGTNVAGTSIEIRNNTFRALAIAVKIRGVPEDRCHVHHNWIARHLDNQPPVVAEAGTTVEQNAYGEPGEVR